MRDRSDDPIIDIGDVGWWCIFGLLGGVPVMLYLSLDWPWWSVVPVGFALGPLFAVLSRRYVRRADARRPSRNRANEV